MAKKSVSYPELLDGLGNQLVQSLKALEPDHLKPALMADIAKTVGLIHNLQQMVTMMYNINVANYEAQAQKVADMEKELEETNTRCAGYSERINALENRDK